MARPRLGDSESKRLQMVITEDELGAIEEWRFENRVQSKSEAIRRLVQIGLRVEREISELIKQNRGVTRQIESILVQTKQQVLKRDAPNVDELVEILRSMFKGADSALLRQMDATEHLFNLVGEIAPLMNTDYDVAEALKTANERRAEVVAGESTYKKILANLKANKADYKAKSKMKDDDDAR